MRIDDLDPLTLERAQAGDVGCQHQVVAACKKLIHWMSYLWLKRSPGMDIRDLEQQGVLGVYDAIRMWDPERGSFPRVAFLWISHRTRSWILKETKFFSRHPFSFDDLDHVHLTDVRGDRSVHAAMLEAVKPDGYSPEDLLDHAKVNEAVGCLPPLHRAAFDEMVVAGIPAKDFGASFGHTQQWATKMRRQAIAQVRRFMDSKPD